MKRTIGILLDHPIWKGVLSGRTGREKISFYNQAARKRNVKLFYFSLPSIDIKRGSAQGYRYHPDKGMKKERRKVPKVIHNRSMSGNPKKFAWLLRTRVVFNGRTRYSKYTIHRQLWSEESLRPHLPETKKCTKEKLEIMMDRYSSLYLKPVSSSIGRGILRLDRLDGDQWQLVGGSKPYVAKRSKVLKHTLKRIKGRRYLISETIPLARYKDKPFDIRVSVQKREDGKWHVTGMVGKVAAHGSHVTNVARGGEVKSCDRLFAECGFELEKTKQEIEQVSIKIAKHLGKRLGRLADLGLDIGLDQKGNVYFIEMNGRDLRYSFGKAGLRDQWYETYENPIRYGKFLLSHARR